MGLDIGAAFKKAFSAETWDSKKNGVDDAFNADKNGFNSSTNQSLVNAVNGGSGGDVVGSTDGGTPNLLKDGKNAFSPKQTAEQFKTAFSNFGDDVINAANAVGDTMGDLYGDAKDTVAETADTGVDMMQQMMLIGAGVLILYLILDE